MVGIYTQGVRRLLQFASLVLILVAIATPISALFDRWDPPNLGNDTEMTVFALVLLLCLLLLVCSLIAAFVVPLTLLCARGLDWDEVASMWNRVADTIFFVPPPLPRFESEVLLSLAPVQDSRFVLFGWIGLPVLVSRHLFPMQPGESNASFQCYAGDPHSLHYFGCAC